jgi:23S rRNA pseudouridine955/2504/2580 synthase
MAGRNTEVKKQKRIRFEDLILHEDDRIVVVNKPGGIASLSDREGDTNLLAMGRDYDPELKLCHRLDKYTTGVLIFAKGAEMYREIAILFEEREIHKHYLALVHGSKAVEEEVIELPIDVSGAGKARISLTAGKDSLTVISTAELFRDYTLMNCHPMTGRLHQVRIHLSAIGMPLVGDLQYGGKDVLLSEIKRNFKPNRKEVESPLNESYMLHARGIMLVIPGDEEESTFIAPLPAKFETALRILRKYNAVK